MRVIIAKYHPATATKGERFSLSEKIEKERGHGTAKVVFGWDYRFNGLKDQVEKVLRANGFIGVDLPFFQVGWYGNDLVIMTESEKPISELI